NGAALQRVEKARHASQKCKHFFEGMQPAASHAQSAHACGLGSVFSKAHVLGKNSFLLCFAACGRQNSAEGFSLVQEHIPLLHQFRLFRQTEGPRHWRGPCVIFSELV
ncbi:MAG: hypothetical protein MSB10_10860, partial [Clostridiales bacterium]|nr:hypothetical protein [Clostridiales bacterium]